MKSVNLRIEVAGKTALSGPLSTAVSVFLPERLQRASPQAVLFAFPGSGYSRGYYHVQLPGRPGYSQAEHHVQRGFVFVACDHLGVGDSSLPDMNAVTHEDVAAANDVTVQHVLGLLKSGKLAEGLPPMRNPVTIGIGQSMGGALLIIQQARHKTFDAVAVLGYSAIHTVIPTPPGSAPISDTQPLADRNLIRYAFHWEDVPSDVVERDTLRQPLPPWASATVPRGPRTRNLRAPGVVAKEAALIDVPLFIGVGERDVCPDPHAEPGAYRSVTDITLCIVPRMAHMHNFAGTRALLWDRLVQWVAGVAQPPTVQ